MNVRLATIVILSILLLRNPALPIEKNGQESDSWSRNVLSTRHFDIYYPTGMEDVAIKAAELAESGYIRVANHLTHETTSIIPLRLFAAGHDLTGCSRTKGMEDQCRYREFMPNNTITVIFHGSYADLQRSITHEMTHIFLNSIAFESTLRIHPITSNRIPYWLAEGMARYLSAGFDESAETILRNIISNRHFTGLRDLSEMKDARGGEFPVEGQAFCHFIDSRFGNTVLGELARDFMDIGFHDTAIQAATGMTVEELERQWIKQLSGRYRYGGAPQGPGKDRFKIDAPAGILMPAASPDGRRIAALCDRNGRSDVVLFDITNGTHITIRPAHTLLPGNGCRGVRPAGVHDNRISWSPDGRTIVLGGISNGRPCLLALDAATGRVASIVKLPFNEIKDPSLSPNGRFILFTGVAASAEDIYLYDRNNKKISRITNDDFSDRFPVMTADGGSIIFSSNWNTKDDPAEPDYHIEQIDIDTGKRASLIAGTGTNKQPELSADGMNLLFVSDRSGSRCVYIYNLSSKTTMRLSDMPAGSSHPRWMPGGGAFIATRYDNQSSKICMGAVDRTVKPGHEKREDYLLPAHFDESYVDPREYVFHEYQPKVTQGWLQIGAAGTINNGYLCYLQTGLTDYMGRHRLVVDANYVREPGKNNINADLAYHLRIERTVLGFGVFRQSNPLSVHSLDEMADHSPIQTFGLNSMEHYGGYFSARTPIGKSFSLSVVTSAGRYDKEYRYTDVRHDLRMTYGKINSKVEYNTIKNGLMVPIRGFRGRVFAEHAFDFTGNRSYTRLGIDLRQHILISKQFTCTFRGAGAAIPGSNHGLFSHYMGGFNTLRGHELNSVSGKNMFLFSAELGFTPVDWRSYGMPLRGGLGNIGAVLFFDAGSAWNGGFRLIDKKTGRLDDLKMDFGIGIRMAISSLLILKLDFAWPFDNKSIKRNEMLFSIGFDY